MTAPSEGFVAQDGLRYANATDRILGIPELSARNAFVIALQANKNEEVAVRAYWKAYDASPGANHTERHESGTAALGVARKLAALDSLRTRSRTG